MRTISAKLVLDCVIAADGFKSTRERVLSPDRRQDVFFVRMAYARIRREMGAKIVQIGKEIHRDHSTVSRLIELHDTDVQYTPAYRDLYHKTKEYIKDLTSVEI